MNPNSVHPDITHPDSVTHFICPGGPTQQGRPVTTHHLAARSAGRRGGEPMYEQTCTYCARTEQQLRQVHGLEG